MSQLSDQVISSSSNYQDQDLALKALRAAIDGVKFLGDVGDTDSELLAEILKHCTVDQLMHIEKSSKGRDLTPITDKLWKTFYEKKFGKDETNYVIKKMEAKKKSFRWKQLYEEKGKEMEKKASKIENRIVKSYQKEKARKESRQIKLLDVSSKSKMAAKTGIRETQICGVSSSSKIRKRRITGRLMEKSKEELEESIEMKNLIVYRRNQMH